MRCLQICRRFSSRSLYNVDERWMRVALSSAMVSSEQGNVPVGAALVNPNGILICHNGNNNNGVTTHAEMRCIHQGSILNRDWRLTGYTLYCTLEPCMSCAAAIALSRVSRVVIATSNSIYGVSKEGNHWIDIARKQPWGAHIICIDRGVLQMESKSLMQAFFQRRRAFPTC